MFGQLRRQQERESLFSTCVLTQGKFFSFTSFKRIPIIVDLNTGEISLLNDLTNYDPVFSADNMLSLESEIFILELNGKRLMRFNVKDRNCSYFNIGCNSENWGNFAAFAYYEKSLYIFPVYSDGLIKIDLETEKVQKMKELYSHMRNYKRNKKQDDEFIFFWCGCQFRNKVWLFQKEGNLVVAYDMESDTWEEYELSVSVKECIHVTVHDEYIFFLSAEGKIYCWDIENKRVEKIADCGSTNKMDFPFSRIAVTDKRIFLLPSISEDIFLIDFDSKKITKYDSYPEDFRYCGPEKWSKYYGYCEDDNWYYFAMRSANYIFTVNKKDGVEKWIKIKIPSYEEFRDVYINYNRKLLYESEYTIDDILSHMKKNPVEKKHENHISGDREIWECIKSFDLLQG